MMNQEMDKILTMLDTAVRPGGTVSLILNVDLKMGSSQQGKQRLAHVGSKCVTAAYLEVPSALK